MSRRLLTCGESALLIEVNSVDEDLVPTAAVPAGIEAAKPGLAGVPDVVPGAETLLWDVDRQPAALLKPGSTVGFVNSGEAARR